ncbi:MAG TPA: cytochrome c oxidase subunit II [Gaiellaceae bacterium]|nr:cytochrome c oxidase subunit II [Gaiellaceae bacterium]
MRRLLSVAVGLGLVAAIVVPSALAQFAPVVPESKNADGIRTSYLFITIFTVAIFLLVEGLLVAFIWKYRRRKRPRFEDGAPIHGATRLELAWTAGPVIVLFIIAVFVFAELPGIKNIPTATAGQEQLEIKVTGQQFYWSYQYPNGVVAVDTMRAPAGVPVKLDVTSPDSDVIHSWWIPALGGKIDAIPGRTNYTWFQADEPGTYKGQCAELCGLQHAHMLASVEVMPQADFSAWLAQRRTDQATGSVELGKETWAGVCAKCHGLAGEGGIGPRVAGSPTLGNPQALATLLHNGRTGPQGVMPAVGADWTDEQISSLEAYLKEDPPSGNPG